MSYIHTKGIKLLTRLRLVFSHPLDHKFKHGFQGTCNPFCSCVNSSYHDIFHCPSYSNKRITLMDKIRDINEDVLNQNDKLLVRIMFIFGDSRFSKFEDTETLNSLNEYILATKISVLRFFRMTPF